MQQTEPEVVAVPPSDLCTDFPPANIGPELACARSATSHHRFKLALKKRLGSVPMGHLIRTQTSAAVSCQDWKGDSEMELLRKKQRIGSVDGESEVGSAKASIEDLMEHSMEHSTETPSSNICWSWDCTNGDGVLASYLGLNWADTGWNDERQFALALKEKQRHWHPGTKSRKYRSTSEQDLASTCQHPLQQVPTQTRQIQRL